jgi:hypothetical protein
VSKLGTLNNPQYEYGMHGPLESPEVGSGRVSIPCRQVTDAVSSNSSLGHGDVTTAGKGLQKIRLMLSSLGLRAARDHYRCTPAVTRGLGFSGLI